MSTEPTARAPGRKIVFGRELEPALAELRRAGFAISAVHQGKANAEWEIRYFKPGVVEEPQKDLFGAPIV